MGEPYQHTSPAKTYRFANGAKNIPHPDKLSTGGQDAFYANDHLLVMADGVGSWAKHKVDSGLYSRHLCKIIEDLFLTDKQLYTREPKLLLAEAVDRNTFLGTSTLTVLTLEETTGILRSAMMGDSVFVHYRGFTELYAAEEHTHSLHHPYQVGTNGDDPEEALEKELQMQEGDVVVLGSNGLWDNLRKEDLKKVVSNPNVQETAELVAAACRCIYMRKGYESPFYQKMVAAGQQCAKVGKTDDVSVVVSRIVCK